MPATPQSLVADSFLQTYGGTFGTPLNMAQAAAALESTKKAESDAKLQAAWPSILESLKGKSPEEQFTALAPALGVDAAAKVVKSLNPQPTEDPSSVREYQYFNSLPPEEQARYLTMKRSSQIMNLGGTQAVYDPLTQGKGSEFNVTPKPEQMPDFKKDQAAATVLGTEQGTAEALLKSSNAKLPELINTVTELNELGKKATYTEAGKLKDTVVRQSGAGATEGAIARADYMAKVDNQVLPLLRDTFGAAFTQKEGDTLRATLGDVDKSPEEKTALLQSFIDQKVASIQSLQRQTGAPVADIQAPNLSAAPELRDGQTATNPQTGEKMVFKGGAWQKM